MWMPMPTSLHAHGAASRTSLCPCSSTRPFPSSARAVPPHHHRRPPPHLIAPQVAHSPHHAHTLVAVLTPYLSVPSLATLSARRPQLLHLACLSPLLLVHHVSSSAAVVLIGLITTSLLNSSGPLASTFSPMTESRLPTLDACSSHPDRRAS